MFRAAVDLSTGRPARTVHLPPSGGSLSPRGRGVLLLFEIRHVLVRRLAVKRESPEYWRAEADLHLFEFRLLESLGGETYLSVVEQYRLALRRAGDLLDKPRKVMNRRIAHALEGIFGKLDQEELHLWGSVAYRNAIMDLLGDEVAFAEHLRAQQLLNNGQSGGPGRR